ncbi:hypothetical protein ScPMuIL_017580 [Solemya velum]
MMNVLSKVLVIGVGGTTNSGKTTLTKRLTDAIPGSSSMCQDNYSFSKDLKDERLNSLRIPELDCWNWEKIEALDMEKMVEDIQTKIDEHSCSVLFVEGFLVFNYEPLLSFFSKKYFLTLTQEECKRRRSLRVYNPADGPQYFDKVVWPEYIKVLEQVKLQPDVNFLDGENKQDDIFNQVLEEVNQLSENMGQGV